MSAASIRDQKEGLSVLGSELSPYLVLPYTLLCTLLTRMDVIASLKETEILSVLMPTAAAFSKVLESHRAEIEMITRQTFRYGETERHNLDVYYPPADAVSGGSIPVLFFIYGGGFATGSRTLSPPLTLAYSNLGAFFAKRGIMTVIPDYRLLPAVKFPEPAEDVRDAIAWFLSNTTSVAAASPAPLTLSNPNLFIMGHSAGAHLVTSLFLLPSILPAASPIRAATRGLIPSGGVFRFDFANPVTPPGVIEQLYGSQETAQGLMPILLLQNADEALFQSLPEAFLLVSEHDPPRLVKMSEEFVKVFEGRLGKPVRYQVAAGHNHISFCLAPSTGEGEEWAVQVAEWIKSKV
ncbi:alpha/beta hydrolase domain-containing protein [Trametes gibbosa]|nr:alpha/beta hydrolase domain-containing protein [Trametes gibbosa]